MKLLLFSDLHCDAEASRQLVRRSDEADVLIGAGDFATCRRKIHITLEILSAVEKPAVLVAGNAESAEELREAAAGWKSAVVLHGEQTEIEGVVFFGLGGAVPKTPFGEWSWDFSEEEATGLLQECPPGAVLVTHSPPYGVVDTNRDGVHLGSRAVRAAIERTGPQLVVCGHIHDCWEETGRIDNTPVINAGPRGILYDLSTSQMS